jgi:hypothetical protein
MARTYSLPLIALLVWGMLYFSQLTGKPRLGFDGAWLSFSPWARLFMRLAAACQP